MSSKKVVSRKYALKIEGVDTIYKNIREIEESGILDSINSEEVVVSRVEVFTLGGKDEL